MKNRKKLVNFAVGAIISDNSRLTPLIGGTVFTLAADGTITDPYIYYCENAGGNVDWDSLFNAN